MILNLPSLLIWRMMQMAKKRYRNFRCVVWVSSANADWIQRLEEKNIPSYIILHDKDKHIDGSDKDPHWHVVLKFDGVKTCEQVLEIMKECAGLGVNVVLPADSLSGSVRYLTHLDSKDKYQYSYKDVISLGGANYFDDIFIPSDLNQYRADIQAYIEQNNICSYYDLSWFATNLVPEWSRCVNAQTLYWVKYLISREDKLRNHIYNDIDAIREKFYEVNENDD